MPDCTRCSATSWGNLIFVVALAVLAGALYLRRPDEPATTPLLVAAAAFLGSTLAFVPGLPALALATGGPLLWLYNINIVGVYAVAWGALLAFGCGSAEDEQRRSSSPSV